MSALLRPQYRELLDYRTERETTMERGFWITVSNSAGILDSAFARTEEEARKLS